MGSPCHRRRFSRRLPASSSQRFRLSGSAWHVVPSSPSLQEGVVDCCSCARSLSVLSTGISSRLPAASVAREQGELDGFRFGPAEGWRFAGSRGRLRFGCSSGWWSKRGDQTDLDGFVPQGCGVIPVEPAADCGPQLLALLQPRVLDCLRGRDQSLIARYSRAARRVVQNGPDQVGAFDIQSAGAASRPARTAVYSTASG